MLMHRFLRSVGFGSITKRQDLDKLLGVVMNDPNVTTKYENTKNTTFVEYRKQFGRRMGISIRGEYDKLGFFHLEHYFPYCECNLISTMDDVYVNKRIDSNAYTGMCDNSQMGLSLIFYLQNAVDYMILNCQDNTPHLASLTLSGLSLSGTILLGLEPSEQLRLKRYDDSRIRNQLINRAQTGDQKAIDSLTILDMDLTSQISRRIKQEDLYSLVETTFYPFGSESDNYSVLGIISNWVLLVNPYTQEEVYQLIIDCNEIILNIAINKKDLIGEPMIGRRFKGVIWMQGFVDFKSTSPKTV